MLTVAAADLRRFATDMLVGAGTPEDLAKYVGDSLVDANLAGHDSHGVMRLGGYLNAVRIGDVKPASRPTISARDRATGIVDGAWGWGQPAMLLATDLAIQTARAHGVSCVVVNHCYHIGRVVPFVEHAAREGFIAIAMSNAGPAVAPEGGRRRTLGTNPLAWAMPRGRGREPLSFDIATAAIAEGKLQVARARGQRIKKGLVVTAEGQASEDPEDFYRGGAILPFGGHKGYGVSLLVQALGCGLAGMDTSRFDGPTGANGPLVIAIDPAPFVDPAQFAYEINALCKRIVTSPPAEGVEAVLLPGQRAAQSRLTREADGVPIPEATWETLSTLARDLGVSPPEPAARETANRP